MNRSKNPLGMLMAGLAVSVILIVLVLGERSEVLDQSYDSIEFDDQSILERAYEDVRDSEEFPDPEQEMIIKIFDEDNELIESMTLLAGDEVTDEGFQKLINQSTLLAEYRTSKVYRMNK